MQQRITVVNASTGWRRCHPNSNFFRCQSANNAECILWCVGWLRWTHCHYSALWQRVVQRNIFRNSNIIIHDRNMIDSLSVNQSWLASWLACACPCIAITMSSDFVGFSEQVARFDQTKHADQTSCKLVTGYIYIYIYINISRCRTPIGRQSFLYDSTHAWNALPSLHASHAPILTLNICLERSYKRTIFRARFCDNKSFLDNSVT